jgi:hypothetical protein
VDRRMRFIGFYILLFEHDILLWVTRFTFATSARYSETDYDFAAGGQQVSMTLGSGTP